MKVYLYGTPGNIGGAATKIRHLLRLLHQEVDFTVILTHPSWRKNKQVMGFLAELKIPHCLLKELPRQVSGVVLAICELQFFSSGVARRLKEKGLKIVWSNEMMWSFKGEAEAVKAGLIDRVLWVSEFQSKVEAFAEMYRGVPSVIVENYIDPDDFHWKERRNETFTIGRLSRPDPVKYPLNFPHFYEALVPGDVRYRVMAWSEEMAKQYRWHRFGPEWELLPKNNLATVDFLWSLDLFVYPLRHRFRESWGRVVVEAMLTGCPPVVPRGHHFHNMLVDDESGYLCGSFEEWQAAVERLYRDYPFRQRMSRRCSDYARETHCDPAGHRSIWLEALSFSE
ncbi:MAG: hypothetical protein M2R45_05201 [Verrucomicrobia subdivision 3 bacterium]|nr:hypothetical protein [Limisphaerales bacterium]MCS1413895.1 hypothetical protein [Limisphaerales bacterium]